MMSPDFPFYGRWSWCYHCDAPIISCLDPKCWATSCNCHACPKCSDDIDAVSKLFKEDREPSYEDVLSQEGYVPYEDLLLREEDVENANKWGRLDHGSYEIAALKGDETCDCYYLDGKYYTAGHNRTLFYSGEEYKGNFIWKNLKMDSWERPDDCSAWGALTICLYIMENGEPRFNRKQAEAELKAWDEERNLRLDPANVRPPRFKFTDDENDETLV